MDERKLSPDKTNFYGINLGRISSKNRRELQQRIIYDKNPNIIDFWELTNLANEHGLDTFIGPNAPERIDKSDPPSVLSCIPIGAAHIGVKIRNNFDGGYRLDVNKYEGNVSDLNQLLSLVRDSSVLIKEMEFLGVKTKPSDFRLYIV
jgi:hypothetical protein